jgi:hypothetical protein
MKVVGCDLHTRYQQIAMQDEETGELIERRGCPGSGFSDPGYHATFQCILWLIITRR